MRDDDSGVPNGRPIPFGRANGASRGSSKPRNGVAHPHGLGDRVPIRVLPVEADGPIDLVAVQADDELVSALGSAGVPATSARPPGFDMGADGTDDRLVALLAAWRAEIEAQPIPELIDLDTAVAAVAAGVAADAASARRRRSARLRHLAPLAAAAAIIVATVSGVGVGSQNAQPGDPLWSIQKVLDSERAESVEAKVTIETRLASVRTALSEGDTATAARELDAIRSEIPAVRGQEGRRQLVQEQEYLAAKLQDATPGAPADLSTPPSSKPNARPTGGPPPAPVAPADPSQTGPAGSTEPTAPLSSAPGGQDGDERDRSGVPVESDADASTAPSGTDPSSADPSSSAPEVTGEPDPSSSSPAPGTGTGTGSVDPTTSPGPVTVPGLVGGGTATSDTTTASGSAGTSVDVTATISAN